MPSPPFQGLRSDGAELTEDGLVARDGAPGERLGDGKGRALVRYLVPHLVRLPRVVDACQVGARHWRALLPPPLARVPAPHERFVEHDVGLDDGLAPLARARASRKPLDMLPSGMAPLYALRRDEERLVVLLLARAQVEDSHQGPDDEHEPGEREQVADDDDPEPESGGEALATRDRPMAGE